MKNKISNYQLGWLVGILEGEGYFEFNGYSQKVTVKMTDEDTIITFADLVSRITEHNIEIMEIDPVNPKAQNIFGVTVCGKNARTLMKLVAPHMHYRRRQRVWQSLNRYKPPKRQTYEEQVAQVSDILQLVRKTK